MPVGQATYYSYISPELAVGLSKSERIHPFGSPGHKDLLGFVLNPPFFGNSLCTLFQFSSHPHNPPDQAMELLDRLSLRVQGHVANGATSHHNCWQDERDIELGVWGLGMRGLRSAGW